MEWDAGPPPAIAQIFNRAPLDEYQKLAERFRLEWGPIYYRGRLDGSARVLVIGQDPSADENIARRILVGTAGQRVQGYLTKLGITSSYVMINTSLYSIYGQFDAELRDFLDQAPLLQWRNHLLDTLAATTNLEAIVAFGKAAEHMVRAWPGAAPYQQAKPIFYLQHPTARVPQTLLGSWNDNLPKIAAVLAADVDGSVDLTPYALSGFTPSDLARIPLRDFGFGAPQWMGTGDMAVRVNRGQTKLKEPPAGASILWTALATHG
jgi:uracil-DNA glycosylase